MRKLGRLLLDSLLPGLIALDPMGAMAYYLAIAGQEPPNSGTPRIRRPYLVSDSVKGATTTKLVDLPLPGPIQAVTRVGA